MRPNLELQMAVALAELKRRRAVDRFLFHMTPGKASSKQIEAWKSDARSRVLLGANRSGKSHFGTIETIMWAHYSTIPDQDGNYRTPMGRTIPRGPVYLRVVCPELPMTLDKEHVQRDKIRLLTPEHWLRGESFLKAYSVMGHTLHFANGSLVEFMSAEQSADKHAGQSIHGIWFDEEMPEQIYNENLARLDRDDSAWWFTYTPVMGLRWIYDKIYLPALKSVDPKKWFLRQIDIEDNRRNLGRNFIESLEDTLSTDEQELRLRGRYSINSGLVYDLFSENHLIGVEVIH